MHVPGGRNLQLNRITVGGEAIEVEIVIELLDAIVLLRVGNGQKLAFSVSLCAVVFDIGLGENGLC